MKGLLLSFAVLVAAQFAHAQSSSQFDIHEVTLTESTLSLEDLNSAQEQFYKDVEAYKKLDDPLTDLTIIDTAVDKIISIGSKIWKIVTDNQPVVNLNTQRVSALPSSNPNWLDMDSWSDLEAKKYNVVYTNGFGVDVVKMSFIITYTHSGRVNGVGRYLSNVGFVVSNLEVMWGYTLNSNAEVVRTQNVGSRENPIAAMEINLNWVVKTPIKYGQGAMNFYIRGDGQMTARTN